MTSIKQAYSQQMPEKMDDPEKMMDDQTRDTIIKALSSYANHFYTNIGIHFANSIYSTVDKAI